MHRALDELYVDGDVVVVQLSLNGTHQGDLPIGLGTIPATGKEFHVPCVDVFRLEDGKVSAFDCYYAGTIMLAQLGVLATWRPRSRSKCTSSTGLLRTGTTVWRRRVCGKSRKGNAK